MLVQIVVQNALAILFPAWMDLGATSTRGMEVMGQRVLIAGGLIVTVGLSLFPAILVAAIVVSGVVHALTGVERVLISATVVAATLLLESALVILRLGRVVDRMDASAVPPSNRSAASAQFRAACANEMVAMHARHPPANLRIFILVSWR